MPGIMVVGVWCEFGSMGYSYDYKGRATDNCYLL